MTFTSVEFLIFLPVVFLLYWFVFDRSVRLQNIFLVVASYVFYGWWDARFLLLIVLSSFSTWGCGLLIRNSRGDARKRKFWFLANILLNLSILFFFKYYDFFVSSFADLFFNGGDDALLLNVILPVGISFYTFQALSYTIDVYREKIEPTEDPIAFFAFLSFFPQLVAGPIERASDFLPQIRGRRTFDYCLAADGCRQILWGLFKKLVLADRCAKVADRIFSCGDCSDGSLLLFGALMFTFQIYGDFSGYSDIAIGTAKLFGIRLSRNFANPFFSRNVAEFWRRWHITLMTWFRDYVYFPLGGSRGSKWLTIRNTVIVFLLTGLWHGANWTFVAWGGWNALLFIPLILTGTNGRYRSVVAQDKCLPSPGELLRMLLTFFLTVVGWIIFRSESISDAGAFLLGMCQLDALRFAEHFFNGLLEQSALFCILFVMAIEWMGRKNEHAFTLSRVHSLPIRYAVYTLMTSLIVLSIKGDSSQFIYFQF